MRKRSVVLALIALGAMAMAICVQIFDRGTSREEERLALARQQEDALAESRLRAEILARRRTEEEATEPPGDGGGPLPGAVLRRSESGRGSALRQVRDSQDEQRAALARLQESLDNLEIQTARSDRALRRDLEALRAEVRREKEVSGKVRILLLAALAPLVLHLLISLRAPGDRKER